MCAGGVVCPHNDPPAIAGVRRVGLDGRFRAEVGNVGILNVGVAALVVTAHPHITAPARTRDIYGRIIHQRHAVAQHIHVAALAHSTRRVDLPLPFHIRITHRAQHDFAAFHVGTHRLNHATVAQRARKNTNGIAFERAQVDGLVGWRLHVQGDALQPTARHLHTLPSGQHHAAALRLDQRRFGDIDIRRNQHHVATPGDDVAVHG